MTYTPALPLRAHQVESLRLGRAKPSNLSDAFANFSEMGTGKTATLLAEFGERAEARDLTNLLVVAPAGSYRNWWREGGEIDRHVAPVLRERLKVAAWVSGAGRGARRELAAFASPPVNGHRDRPRVLCVNVEALGVVSAAQELVLAFLDSGPAMMVIDESTRVRTPDSLRTDFVVRSGVKAVARRIMTGLPTPKSPLDLFSQFEFLDWRILGHRSFFTFRMRYAVMEQIVTGVTINKKGERKLRRAWVDVAYRNEDELRQKIAPWHCRFLKEDCLDLPPKTYMRREVELTDEQQRAYDDLRTKATAELDSGEFVSSDRKIDQIMRMQQVVWGYVRTESGAVQKLKSNRLRGLLDVAEESSGKGVVWFACVPQLLDFAAALEQELGEGTVARFWGGNAGTRHEDEARWKSDPRCRIMCATVQAGGVGNNWAEGGWAVYPSNSYDLEHRMQSEDREHRMGQTRAVVYTDLVAPGTVDERILEVLKEKMDMASALMGEEYRRWLE